VNVKSPHQNSWQFSDCTWSNDSYGAHGARVIDRVLATVIAAGAMLLSSQSGGRFRTLIIFHNRIIQFDY
jgi:hypothetical protein